MSTLTNPLQKNCGKGHDRRHEGTVNTGGRTNTNLLFADDMNGLAGGEEGLVKLVELLDKASTAYGMEISTEKTKMMTNNTSGINKIRVNGHNLKTVTNSPG